MTATTNGNVLILEDDYDLAMQWRREFTDAGFVATVATSRPEAAMLCDSTEFQLVIADIFIRLPDGPLVGDGGLTLLAHLRSPWLTGTPEWGTKVPIIAVTGSELIDGFDVLEYARDAGADIVVRKPVSPTELVLTALRLLGNHDD